MRPEVDRHAAGPKAAPVALRVVEDVATLRALAEPWGALAGTASPMQGHAWTLGCALVLGDGRVPHVVVVGESDEVVAVAPLARARRRPGRLHLLGVEELGEPGDFLAADPRALERLVVGVAASGRPLVLPRVLADSPLVSAVRRAYRGRGLVICRRHASYPWIPLGPRWTEPESQLNPGRRSDLRRARRIAERTGRVEVAVLAPGQSQLDGLFDEALRVEAAGWKGRCGSALLGDPGRQAFYRRWARVASRDGVLRLCFLRIDGRAVAMQLAAECGGRFWLLKIGYDERYRRCSPGNLLLAETIRHAAARGLRSFELLGGVEPWTRTWTAHERACVSVRAYPVTRAGALALALDAITLGARRLARALGSER